MEAGLPPLAPPPSFKRGLRPRRSVPRPSGLATPLAAGTPLLLVLLGAVLVVVALLAALAALAFLVLALTVLATLTRKASCIRSPSGIAQVAMSRGGAHARNRKKLLPWIRRPLRISLFGGRQNSPACPISGPQGPPRS